MNAVQTPIEMPEQRTQEPVRQKNRIERRLLLWRRTAALLCGVTFLVLSSRAGSSQGQTLEQRVCALEAKTTSQETRINTLQSQVTTLTSQVSELRSRFTHFSRVGNEIILNGGNLHIRNGRGATASMNGLGNLFIGYNERRNDGSDVRTGSHYLVVGNGNSFSSWGGLIAGSFQTVTAPFATITGGYGNTASGPNATVSGGWRNVASGLQSAVSGGDVNTSSGARAWVGGGSTNLAVESYAAIVGGYGNYAAGPYSTVAGGSSRGAYGSKNWRIGSLFGDF